MTKLQLEAAVTTHVGRVRTNNEDNFYLYGRIREDVSTDFAQFACTAPAKAFLAAVCDGMGGESCGERASLIGVQALRPARLGQIREAALESISRANERICNEMEQNSIGRMGSTFAAIYMDEDKAVACNVGDSRIYLWRDGALRLLSVEHSKAAHLVRMGVLTPEQAARHPSRHVLTQHLGIFPHEMELEPAFSEELELRAGDCLLVCSDGLTDMVPEENIVRTLREGQSAEKTAQMLQELALENGGRDNVTVLIVRVSERPGLWQRLMGGAR